MACNIDLIKGGKGSIEDSTVVVLYVDTNDLNQLKAYRNLATSINNTFLSAEPDAIRDTSGNVLETATKVRASFVSPDIIRPRLVEFSLDLNLGTMTLLFDETVSAATATPTSIVIQGNQNLSTSHLDSFHLIGGSFDQIDSTELKLNLTDIDQNRIKVARHIATTNDNAFISIDASMVDDMFGNDVVAVEYENAIRIANLTEDTTPPRLIDFTLDLDEGRMLLTFSEAVKSSTLRMKELILQSAQEAARGETTFYSLTGGRSSLYSNVVFPLAPSQYVNLSDSTTLEVFFSSTDLNSIKKLENLATEKNNSFLIISSLFVQDMNENWVAAISNSSALKASTVTPDRTAPSLVSFDLDLNEGKLILSFSETVDRSSLNVTSIVLQHDQVQSSDPQLFHRLANRSRSTSEDGVTIVIDLHATDLNEVKRLPALASTINNTYLTLSSSAINDMNSNAVVEISINQGLRALALLPDVTQPELLEFDLDLDSGEVTLLFSETVNASSLNIVSITLQGVRKNINLTYENFVVLRSRQQSGNDGSWSSSDDGTHLIVQLSRADLNALKAFVDLATKPNNTFISIKNNTVLDMSGLYVKPIDVEGARSVRLFTRDESGPRLQQFSLNLTSETLSLTYDETVDSSTLDVTLFSIQSFALNTSTEVKLTSFKSATLELSPIIVITLAHVDLSHLKLDEALAVNRTTTWLEIKYGGVRDTSVPPNPSEETIQVATDYAEDLLSPVLLSFSVDLTQETLTLLFDEPVLIATLDPTALTFQGAANRSQGSSYTLQGGNATGTNGERLVLRLSQSDLNSIKKETDLLVSLNTSYLAFTEDLVKDMNNNPIISVESDSAIRAIDYVMQRQC